MNHLYKILLLMLFLAGSAMPQQMEAVYENVTADPFAGQEEPIALGILKFNGSGNLESRFYDVLKSQPGIHNKYLIFPYDALQEQEKTLGLRNLDANDRRTLSSLSSNLDLRLVAAADVSSDGSFILRLIRTSDGSEVFRGKYTASFNSTPVQDAVKLFTQKQLTVYKKALPGPQMVKIEGGWFDMGSNEGDNDEKPVHRVYVDSFAIARYEITFDEFDRFCEMTNRPKPEDNGWGRGKRPVINVSWTDAGEYCNWLSSITGSKFRLPTEAEWEFAAKGGNKNSGFRFSGSDNIDEVGWNSGNSGGNTHEAGTRKPNELDLYDMNGNVWEWCSDWYNENYYGASPKENPRGPASGLYHTLRGGSWYSYGSRVCRTTVRVRDTQDYKDNTAGFRVVREL